MSYQESIIKELSLFPDREKNLRKVFRYSLYPIFKVPEYPDIKNFVENGKPYTRDSLNQKTGYLPYDFWLNLTIRMGTDEDIAHLCTKIE